MENITWPTWLSHEEREPRFTGTGMVSTEAIWYLFVNVSYAATGSYCNIVFCMPKCGPKNVSMPLLFLLQHYFLHAQMWSQGSNPGTVGTEE
jgi:hypothetical protein